VYPEDRVLVGVINRKRDFEKVQREHWYRVPQHRASKGVHAEYVAFFFSRAFKELNGAIHYYARRTGVELVRRRDLLPDEPDHPRADALYHKLQLGELRQKDPPIRNADRRVVTFIYTTWDRFEAAETLADLYSESDQFVDRLFHALEQSGVRSERVWDAERGEGAGLRVVCEDGIIIASTQPRDEHVIPLPSDDFSDQALARSFEAVLAAIKAHGGPLMIHVPLEE
jgi:hypothetical protein